VSREGREGGEDFWNRILKIAQRFSAGFNRANLLKSRRDERKPLPSLRDFFISLTFYPALKGWAIFSHTNARWTEIRRSAFISPDES
jgi:hypothetical protein